MDINYAPRDYSIHFQPIRAADRPGTCIRTQGRWGPRPRYWQEGRRCHMLDPRAVPPDR